MARPILRSSIPTEFNPDQWMKAIRDSGAKYVVLVAKHHDGFCLWPTEQTNYSVKSSPWKGGKGDVVGDVARAARQIWSEVSASIFRRGTVMNPDTKTPPSYDDYYPAELSELAQNYGDLVEFWLDGAGSAGPRLQLYEDHRDTAHLPAQHPGLC